MAFYSSLLLLLATGHAFKRSVQFSRSVPWYVVSCRRPVIRKALASRSFLLNSASNPNNEKKDIATFGVDEMLALIAKTDKGASASKETQLEVNNWMQVKSNEYEESLSSKNKEAAINSNDQHSATNILTALDDENLYGNYDVSYVSTLKASKQQGNPAGGNFRGAFGRFIYENEGLYQHILKEDEIIINKKDSVLIRAATTDNSNNGAMDASLDVLEKVPGVTSVNIPSTVPMTSTTVNAKIEVDSSINAAANIPDSSVSFELAEEKMITPVEDSKNILEKIPQNVPEILSKKSRVLAINYITGKLFRFIPVSVILKGVVQQISETERTELTAKYGTILTPSTVRADFESPLITIGGIGIRIGPDSNVVLDTPYLDNKMRLGVGARGSSFIFRKTSEEKANNWKIDVKRKVLNAKKLGFAFLTLAAIILSSFTNNQIQLIQIAKNAVSLPLIFFGLILFFTKGGIRGDENKILP